MRINQLSKRQLKTWEWKWKISSRARKSELKSVLSKMQHFHVVANKEAVILILFDSLILQRSPRTHAFLFSNTELIVGQLKAIFNCSWALPSVGRFDGMKWFNHIKYNVFLCSLRQQTSSKCALNRTKPPSSHRIFVATNGGSWIFFGQFSLLLPKSQFHEINTLKMLKWIPITERTAIKAKIIWEREKAIFVDRFECDRQYCWNGWKCAIKVDGLRL